MRNDAFSGYHPAVNFLFFVGAIGFGVVFQHPAYLLAGIICGACYFLLLQGRMGFKMILAMLPLCLIIAGVNPLLNTRGELVLFYVFRRPYTLEALLYGGAVAGIFLITMLWFGCYSHVMTGDKFTGLFGNLIPSLSLLLVMVFRMVPGLLRKMRQITGARRSIGKGLGANGTWKEKVAEGMTVLSGLAGWALEGSIVTADSMRSRGYGTARRTGFRIWRMELRDWILILAMLIPASLVLSAVFTGGVTASYMPELVIPPVTGLNSLGFIGYCCFLLIPSILYWKEALVWRISRSKI